MPPQLLPIDWDNSVLENLPEESALEDAYVADLFFKTDVVEYMNRTSMVALKQYFKESCLVNCFLFWHIKLKMWARYPLLNLLLDNLSFVVQGRRHPVRCRVESMYTYYHDNFERMSSYTVAVAQSVELLLSADHDDLIRDFPAPDYFEDMGRDREKWRYINFFLMTYSLKDVPEFLSKVNHVKELRTSQDPSHRGIMLIRSWDAYEGVFNIIKAHFTEYCKSYPFERLARNGGFRQELGQAVNEHIALAYITTPQRFDIKKSLDQVVDLLYKDLRENLYYLRQVPFEITGNREPVYALLIIHMVFTVLRFSFTVPQST